MANAVVPGAELAFDPFPVRLAPGDDLRRVLEDLARAQGWQAAFVLAGIGSLRPAAIRLAGAEGAPAIDQDLELITLSGSLGPQGAHLHASVADAQGRVTGGHVAYGCVVRTTAELLVAVLPGWRFARALDERTGYPELVVSPQAPGSRR